MHNRSPGYRTAMRWLLIVLLTPLGLLAVEEFDVEATDNVVQGPLDPVFNLRLGIYPQSIFRCTGSPQDFRLWLGLSLPQPAINQLQPGCVAALRALHHAQAILVSASVPTAAALQNSEAGGLLTIGSQVPEAMMLALLNVVHQRLPGRIALVLSRRDPGIISVTPLIPQQEQTVTGDTWERLRRIPDNGAGILALLDGYRQGEIKLASVDDGGPLQLDLDFRAEGHVAPVGVAAGRWQGGQWSADGWFVRGRQLAPLSHEAPEVLPIPQPPYQAEIAVPGISSGARAVTITMLVCLASCELGQDNLFTFGKRSRWLSAQVDTQGRLRVGFDNRWRLVPQVGAAFADLPPLTLRTWHVLTVAVGAHASRVMIAIDGKCSGELIPEGNPGGEYPRTPQRVDGPAEDLLTLVDPGSTRHLHGMVRRIIVQRGWLAAEATRQLHTMLAPAALALPSLPEFNLPPIMAVDLDAPLPEPHGADNF